MRHIAVIDIGKTNAKILAVDLATGEERIVARQPNAVLDRPPYRHADTDALWAFVLRGLRQAGLVDAVSVTTHGATAALVAEDGALALPVLDYEDTAPEAMAGEYDALRPGFEETGSPRLPMGLNLGAQLYWQAQEFPRDFARARHVLMYPQYWSFRLTGVAASEVTSLGCHTDLWAPLAGGFSALVDRMGWRLLFPPIRPAAAVLGPILPSVAAAAGLADGIPVLCGIHDSNASLVPHLDAPPPRAVLSTGTWMIAMAIGGRQVPLDPDRDLLMNVNARGAPVPTARYMAGREFDQITEGSALSPDEATLARVLTEGVMALPSLHPGTGPFPGLTFAWAPEAPTDPAMRVAAASFYAALMGAECLSLIGAEGPVVVEGAFGGNAAFLRMLAAATGRPVLAAGQGAGTGLGAALLAGTLATTRAEPTPVMPENDALWSGYAALWRQRVQAK